MKVGVCEGVRGEGGMEGVKVGVKLRVCEGVRGEGGRDGGSEGGRM